MDHSDYTNNLEQETAAIPQYSPGSEPENVQQLLKLFFGTVDRLFPNKTISIDKWQKYDKLNNASFMLCDLLNYRCTVDLLKAYGYKFEDKESVPSYVPVQTEAVAAASAEQPEYVKREPEQRKEEIREPKRWEVAEREPAERKNDEHKSEVREIEDREVKKVESEEHESEDIFTIDPEDYEKERPEEPIFVFDEDELSRIEEEEEEPYKGKVVEEVQEFSEEHTEELPGEEPAEAFSQREELISEPVPSDNIRINNKALVTPGIPIWEKYTLTIQEAAEYFRIGENKLRDIVKENRNAPFILWNGNRPQIKRKLFEEYVDRINSI